MQEIPETWVQSLGQEDPLEEGGHGNSLQYSYLENSTDRGAWRATVHGVTENQTQLRTTTLTFIHICKQVHTASEKIPKLEFCLDAGHTEIWSGLKSKIAGS